MNNRQPTPNRSTYNRAPAAPQNRPAQPAQKRPPQKKKLRIRPNTKGILSLLALLVIAAAIITVLVIGIKAIANAVSGNTEETTDTSNNNGGEENNTGKWNEGFTTIILPTTDVTTGDLILINFENKYPHTDTLNSKQLSPLYLAEGYSSYYVLNGTDIKVHTRIKSALIDMIKALVDANPETLGTDKSKDRVIITSGYRTTEKQIELYENRTEEGFVAVPGGTEHHAGYAVDLQVFTSNSRTVLLRDSEQEWMNANCADYGFIVRYDGSKYELTGILDEPWHYRYVGVAHATYIMESGLCMEEYLSMLRKSHTYGEKDPLAITAGETEYLVYYVPASTETTTDIPVPPATLGTYTISGDNMNGFIVTIEKAAEKAE